MSLPSSLGRHLCFQEADERSPVSLKRASDPHRVPANGQEGGDGDTVWSGVTWQGCSGPLKCLSPLCCSNWEWNITHRRIDLTRECPLISR